MATRIIRTSVILVVLLVVGLIVSTQLSVFVVQPIGAMPDGRTLVISRMNASTFIDSPDAMCERIQGNVNLLCRAMVIGQIGKNATIYMRLPYSSTLYLISTGGRTFDR